MTNRASSVLITGATSGIGRELLGLCYDQGFQVIAHGRSELKLSTLVDQFPGVQTVLCDLADLGAVEQMMDGVLATHPAISLVINNAAVQMPGMITQSACDPCDADREMAINFLAPLCICHAVMSRLAKQHGMLAGGTAKDRIRIVNVSSGLAFFPKTGSAVYCASKAALHSLSQSLRYQISEAGLPIAISEVFLPVVDTPMTKGRNMRKISALQAASEIWDGITENRDEIFVGKARWIPVLNRVSPALMKSILRRG
mgnify:CR=1 FL=1